MNEQMHSNGISHVGIPSNGSSKTFSKHLVQPLVSKYSFALLHLNSTPCSTPHTHHGLLGLVEGGSDTSDLDLGHSGHRRSKHGDGSSRKHFVSPVAGDDANPIL